MKIEDLYAKEERDPISIRIWLKTHGFSENSIDLALAEFAQRLANGERFGYVNGVSVLSNRIRDRARELNMKEEKEVMFKLGKFSPKKPWWKRLWQ